MHLAEMTYPWIPDRGDGTYVNPVLHADYSDPDVIRHGDDFWLVSSSFNCTPGLPVLHSRDLVNWELVNHAIEQVPHPRYSSVQPGCGVWAPSIRHHAGRFWIFFPMPDEGIYVTTAEHPGAKWCEPWLLQQATGWIDPCPFWDDDGKAYLVHAYANSRAGKRDRLHVRPMSPDGRKLLGEGKEVVHAQHHPYLEGPKMHKIGEWYYLLAPGGGVPTGWQVVFRSKSIFGPYEEKTVLEQGSTTINGPHQGALVDLPNGQWCFLHFQDAGAFGRIVHLQPVKWQDGWPLMGVDYDGDGVGEPVATWTKPALPAGSAQIIPATSDNFRGAALGLQWQWNANHRPDWASLTANPGWLRLEALPQPDLNLAMMPHFLGQKYPAPRFTVETVLDFAHGLEGEIAGLGIVGGKHHAALALRKGRDEDEYILLENGSIHRIGPANSRVVRLKVRVAPDASFQFLMAALDGPFALLPQVFKATEGAWLGARVGLFSIANGWQPGGSADFGYFNFGPE